MALLIYIVNWFRDLRFRKAESHLIRAGLYTPDSDWGWEWKKPEVNYLSLDELDYIAADAPSYSDWEQSAAAALCQCEACSRQW